MMSQLFDSLLQYPNFFPLLIIVSHYILRSKTFPAPVMSSARLTGLVVGDVSFSLSRSVLVPSA